MRKTYNKQAKELRDLEKMQQGDIDLSDLPEASDWTGAVVGKFYRPVKKPVTLRVDADVLAWLRSQGKGYQTRINAILRAAMANRVGRRKA